MTTTELYNRVKHLQDDFSITQEDCTRIAGVIKDSDNILELGSHKGFSTVFLANRVEDNGEVVSVDSGEHVPYTEREKLFKGLGLTNITIVNKTAIEFLTYNTNRFDVIFHDAAHGDTVIPEYVMAKQYIKARGVFIIHDWEQITIQQHVLSLLKPSFVYYTWDSKARCMAYLHY